MVLNDFSQQTQKHRPSPRNLQSFATPQASGGGGRAPRACRQGIAFVPCPSLVVPFSRAPGERHGAPEPRPRDPRGNSWHHRQHRESALGRIRPAEHDGPIMADPSGASHRTRRACARLGAPVWLRRAATGFCARRRQPAALHAQVCPEADFLAQHALCMPTPRAHYPVGCRGRGDHLCPPFFACPACALFRSPADLKGTVDIGVLCPSYSRTHHTV